LIFCFPQISLLYYMQFSMSNPTLLVEAKGLEPLTPCVQGRCSPN